MITLFLLGLLQVVPANQTRALRGPMRVLWIQAVSKSNKFCSVDMRRIGHRYELGKDKEVLFTVNPGETRNIDFDQIKEWLGNDFDKAESLQVEPKGCAEMRFWIEPR